MSLAKPIRYDGIHCTMEVASPAPGLVVIRIDGRDVGEFGDRPLRALEHLLDATPGASLFIDARRATSASIEVSGTWAQWLGRNRTRFDSVHMLAGSRFVHITAEFVRDFAEMEEQMIVHDDAEGFDGAMAAARMRS